MTHAFIASGAHVDPSAFFNCSKLEEIHVADFDLFMNLRTSLPSHQKHLVKFKCDEAYLKYKLRMIEGQFSEKDCLSAYASQRISESRAPLMKVYGQVLKLAATNGNRSIAKPGTMNWLRRAKDQGKTVISAVESLDCDNKTKLALTKAVQNQLNADRSDFEHRQICHPHHNLAQSVVKRDSETLPDLAGDEAMLGYMPANVDAETRALWLQFFKFVNWTQHEPKLAAFKADFAKLVRNPANARYPYSVWSKSSLNSIVSEFSRFYSAVKSNVNPAVVLAKRRDALTQLGYCNTGLQSALESLSAALSNNVLVHLKQLVNQVAQAYLARFSNSGTGNEVHLPLQRIYQYMGLPVKVGDHAADMFHMTMHDQHLRNIAELAMAHCNAAELAVLMDPICLVAGESYRLDKGDLDHQLDQLKQYGLLSALRVAFPLPANRGSEDEAFHDAYALLQCITSLSADQICGMYDQALCFEKVEITLNHEGIEHLRDLLQPSIVRNIEAQSGIALKADIDVTIARIQAFLTHPADRAYTDAQSEFWAKVLTSMDGLALVSQAVEAMENSNDIEPSALIFEAGLSTCLYQRLAGNPMYTDMLLGRKGQPALLAPVLERLTAEILAGDDAFKKQDDARLENCLFQSGGLRFALRYMCKIDTRFKATAITIRRYMSRKRNKTHFSSLPELLAHILAHGNDAETSAAESLIKGRFEIHKELGQYELITSYLGTINNAMPATLVCTIDDLISWYKASQYSTAVLANGLWALINSDEDWGKFSQAVNSLDDAALKRAVIKGVRGLHPDCRDFLQPSPSAILAANRARVIMSASPTVQAGEEECKGYVARAKP